MNFEDIEKNKERKCIKCGQCMTVCPVYNVTKLESDVSRGKLSIVELLNQKQSKSKIAFNSLSRCLLCGSCSKVCANKVPTDFLIRNAKSDAKKKFKSKLLKIPVKTFTGTNLNSKIIRKGGALLENLIAKKIPEYSGLYLRFPISSFINRQFIPKIQSKSFLSNSALNKKTDNNKQKIGYFIGCGSNYIFTEIPKSLINFFSNINIDIITPKEQVCCGLPAWCMGDTKASIKLAKKNILAFEKLDISTIITSCASCKAHLKNLPLLFDKNSNWYKRAINISNMVWDSIVYIDKNIDSKVMSFKEPDKLLNIVYHEPCHLKEKQSKNYEVDNLFKSFKNINFIHLEDKCCGHGGTFNVNHYDLSKKILEIRMKDILSIKPDYIVTACTGCQLQLLEGIFYYKLKTKVTHPLNLIQWVQHKKVALFS